MRKTLTAVVAVATLAAALALPTDASAQRRWRGPAIVGGFVAGAIVGSALARPYYYPPAYYYAPAPVYYYAPGPVRYEYYRDPDYRPYDGCWRQRHGDRQGVCY
jgi:hypothetical protein